ncbi:LytTR family transcriptional regulator DNA-binding domain-containing protein [Pedobacter psychroterrae]|uniref:LytTR family transcriptional regulator n=1 Tax=Pedobacter psychroterrae TaxID=2530453 RepID=A0A4R0NUM1_9SPHI|nr:LytTR family transcriptional regulator DNA-binding domain-containing protein [Pedobacter psychroterrae]TCD02724.1 LytTR family transcriptional regulator [Pedobacter psychroterrae]
MELKSKFQRKEKYKDFFLPVASSLVAAHTIVCYKQSENPLEVVFVNGYFLSLTFSFTVALVLFYVINVISWILDSFCPWEHSKWKRFWLQLTFGVGGTMLLHLIVSGKYLYNQANDISQSVYFDQYLFMMLSFVVVVNMYYNAEAMVYWKYFGKLPLNRPDLGLTIEHYETPQLVETPMEAIETELTPALRAGILKKLNMYNIALFYCEQEIVYIKETSGKITVWAYRLSSTMKVLDPNKYIRVSRTHIVSRDAILRVNNEPMKNKATIFLKPPYNDIIFITRSNIHDFNVWW